MDHVRFFRNRMLQLVPVLIGISLIVFLMLRLIPGDPARIMLGTHATDEQLANLHAQMGLDRPVWQQYVIFVGNALTGNLGVSLFARRPVLQIISEKMPVTLALVAYASVLALVVTIPLSFVAALRRDSLLDYGIRGILILGLAMPGFWLGLILLLLFAVQWHVFPIAGVGNDPVSQVWHLFLPALTLSLPMAAMLIRKHVLPNSLISVVTILGLNIGWLVGGSVVVETVFSIPGMGNLAVTSVFARDYPMVQGITLIFGVAVIVINLLTDYTYALLDPRVTYE